MAVTTSSTNRIELAIQAGVVGLVTLPILVVLIVAFAGEAGQGLLAFSWLLFTLWVIGFLTFQLLRNRSKSLWFLLEGPFFAFTAKVALIFIFCAIIALTIQSNGASKVDGVMPYVALLTGALATVGWNYTAYENRRAEIRKFTVETLEKVIEDVNHKRLITETWIACRNPGPIGDNDLFEQYQTLHQSPWYRACVNYFMSGKEPETDRRGVAAFEAARRTYALGTYCDHMEWLALLIRQRRIDEVVAREMLGDTVLIVTRKLSGFMAEAKAAHPDYYEHVRWLAARWTPDAQIGANRAND